MNAKLNPRDFIHEDDRKALEALRGIEKKEKRQREGIQSFKK